MRTKRETVADRLKRLRIARGFATAADAAREIGVEVPTYSGHENGSRGVTVAAALRYARFFGVSLEYLLTGVDVLALCAGCHVRFDEHMSAHHVR